MMTAEIPARATTRTNGATIRCAAKNHKDAGEIVIHDRCGEQVAKREDGKLFDLRSYNFGPLRYVCFNSSHTCDEDAVRAADNQRAEARANGEITKGDTVKVIKGRKVPIGTTGTVFWIGDSDDQTRLGIKDADGTTHWTAASNVEIVTPAPIQPEAETANVDQVQPEQPTAVLPPFAMAHGTTANGGSYKIVRDGNTVYVWGDGMEGRQITCNSNQEAADRFAELAIQFASH